MQNHLLQLLALFTMETPVTLDAEDIRNEKVQNSHPACRLKLFNKLIVTLLCSDIVSTSQTPSTTS